MVNDSTDIILGNATILISFKKETDEFYLDFDIKTDSSERGMQVNELLFDGVPIKFISKENRLIIHPKQKIISGEFHEIKISYHGIPNDGLIISKNKFGDRTFFADNWPDRAQYWIPTVDHPSDKATVEFLVTAPEHYQVVSNGIKIEESNLNNGYKFTYWKESVPISTKVMVIGIADFAVKQEGNYN
ncbi:MAG: hypothetical protein HQ541_17625 [Mariniphaga sp.]|nr:hypothetical protein [Mariniphaga sp.]